MSEDDARGIINAHMTILRLGAPRVIGRSVDGEIVRLTAADLRLPPIAEAA